MSTVRIQVRRGLASEWTTANPVLAAGEMGVETNTNLFKFGNGTSTWTSLAYANNSDVAIGEISQDAINNALSLGAGLTKTYDDGANTITITVDTDVVSTKAFATSEATDKAATAKSESIAAAATDATTKADAARADAIAAAEDYTDSAINGVNNSLSDYLGVAERGAQNGVASLDGSTKIPEAQLKLTDLSTNISTSGDISADSITVSGNLIVNGTTTTLDTQNFTTTDPMLYIGEDNDSNQLDLGFVAAHNDGTYNHTGLVRDASDGKWKLFTGVTDEPTTTINFDQASLAKLAVGDFEASKVTAPDLSISGTVELPSSVITEANLTPSSVTADKIATDSVGATKLQSNSVSTDKIADSAVTEDKLALNAVTTAKIADAAVTTAEIADAAVSTAKIADAAVSGAKIADDSISTLKIADAAVVAAKIANDSVSADKIADSAVITAKIADAAVVATKIADLAVVASKIAGLAIDDSHISGTAAIAQSKIDGLVADLEALAPKVSPVITGTVVLPSTTSIGDVTSTEIGYLDGVTSGIQAQIAGNSTALAGHESNTENVHGIADTSLLATTANVATAKTEAITAAGTAAENYADGLAANYEPANAVSTHNSATTSVHGIADTADLLLKSGGTMTGALTLSGAPSSSLHAATKQYVDNTASGIVAKPQVLGATTTNLDATYNNGTAGVGATLTHNTNGEFPAGAGGASGWAVGKGILVKNQTNKAQNGRYYISDMGSPSTPYVLTRCGYCDEASEIPGAYIFVQDGTSAGTGWVQTVADATTFTVGTDDINVVQFSGSGTITAGTNISVSGNEVSVVATPSLSGIVFPDKTQTKAGVPSLTTIATAVSSNTSLDALGTDAAVRDSLIPLSGAVNVSFEATGNAKYEIGSSISFYQASGTGANITGSGITILSTPGSTLRTTNSSVTATKIAASTWLLAGDLKA
jgi:hypothetical protein